MDFVKDNIGDVFCDRVVDERHVSVNLCCHNENGSGRVDDNISCEEADGVFSKERGKLFEFLV